MRAYLLVISLGAFACGAGAKSSGPTTPTDGKGAGTAAAPAAPAVLDFESMSLEGVVVLPTALDLPNMPGGDKIRAGAIDDQRKRYQKAKGKARTDEGIDLVSMLWYVHPADGPVPADQRKEAVAVLRELAPVGKADEELELRLAVAEQGTGNWDSAGKAWSDLHDRFAKSKRRALYEAMLSYLNLRQGRATGAVDGGASPAPEVLYVNAWAKLLAGETAEGVKALEQAAAAWPNLETVDLVNAELVVFYARAGTPAAQAIKQVEAAVQQSGDDLGRALEGLARRYEAAGAYQAAIDTYAEVGKKVGARAVAAHTSAADLYVKLEQPDRAAEEAITAWKSATVGNDASNQNAAATAIGTLAVRFAGDYSHSLDPKYGTPAKTLYDFYAKLPNRPDAKAMADQGKEVAKHLDGTVKMTPPAALEKDLVRRHFVARIEVILACYEHELESHQDLAGTVRLTMVIAADGSTSEVDTDPGAGKDLLPGVAACASQTAKSWTWPALPGGTGTTKVTIPLALARKK